VIRCYRLEVDERQAVDMAAVAVPLSLTVEGGTPVLFTYEEADAAQVPRAIFATPTDTPSSDIYNAHYLGTVYVSGTYWHYFVR
jgi:hypothetical protein